MKKRYLVLGLTAFIALALAVPALGGPSNPLASTAAGAKKTAKKALKKAKAAKKAAKNAQLTADDALSAANNAQTSADNAQSTADQALASANSPNATKLGLTYAADTSPNNSNDKSIAAVCPTGTAIVGGWGFTSATANVKLTGTLAFYDATFALGREDPATGANWTVTAQASCINE